MEPRTGSPFAPLERADRGAAPEPPKNAPAGARSLSAAKGKGSLRRAKDFRGRNSVPHALRALRFAQGRPPRSSSFASLWTPAKGPRERSSHASARRRPPPCCVSRREEQAEERILSPFLKRFWTGTGPLGAEHGGICRERSEFRACASGYGAEPCRLVRAKAKEEAGLEPDFGPPSTRPLKKARRHP